MGKWKYKKKESALVQGVCVVCEQRQQKRKRRQNNIVYLPYCNSCERTLYPYKQKSKLKGYRKLKNTCCAACGFVPIHKCQLDVDHIDGNHSNNDPDNLQTLCANCHRLKTYIQLWDPLLEKIE